MEDHLIWQGVQYRHHPRPGPGDGEAPLASAIISVGADHGEIISGAVHRSQVFTVYGSCILRKNVVKPGR